MAKSPASVPSAPSPKQGASESPGLFQIEFPKQVTPFVWLAMGVGLALCVFGFAAHDFVGFDPGKDNLAMAAGIAIILAAFGGQATLRGKAFVFAGVAAIAIGLYYLLDRSSSLIERSYVHGRIANLPVDAYKVHLKFGTYALGSQAIDTSQFEFVAFAKNITDVNEASLEIIPLKNNPTGEEDDGFPIPVTCFAPWIGEDRLIDWRYDAHDKVLREASGTHKAIAGPKQTKTEACASSTTNAAALDTALPQTAAFSIVSAASAQEVPAAPDAAQIDDALMQLSNDNTDLRRSARDVLSRIGPADIRHVLDFAHQNLNNYRISLGVSVGLTGMLRRDKSIGQKLQLTPADIDMLLDFATATDRTLRIYAGEFLFDLGSPDVTRKALTRASQLTSDSTQDDARFNLIFVSQDGWARLSSDEQKNFGPIISAIRGTLIGKPSTQQLLDSFVKM